MKAKRSRAPIANAQRWGAKSVAAVIGSASRAVASRFCSSFQHSSSKSVSSKVGQAASFRAQLRLARRRNVQLRVMSPVPVFRIVAVASSISLFHHRLQFRREQLPNTYEAP
jgi:hypothetical protein